MHTRSNFTGDLSFACSMRNFGRWLRTAVCSSIGMLTRPKDMEPFQRALGMKILPGSRVLLAAFQFALGFQPVLEIPALAAAAFEIALIGAHADVFVAWLRAHGYRVGLRGRPRSVVGLGRLGRGGLPVARRLIQRFVVVLGAFDIRKGADRIGLRRGIA